MITWILNLIGILIYFISKYANRRNATKFSVKFWFADNWPELISTLLLNIALMLLLLQPETTINLDEWLASNVPFGLSVAVKPLFAFLLGLGLSSFLYKMFKNKLKK
ncbi:MAG TPA: hypothetical protein PLV65_05310 [Tenuifilaceae bacterium]|nr:hypothetical protein [Tenuifilaceae bacterium]